MDDACNDTRKIGFAPLGGRIINKDFIGFDCETYVNKKGEQSFRMASLVFRDGQELLFNSKRDMINHIFQNMRVYQGKFIVATNLQFDLTTLFFKEPEWNDLKLVWSKSILISATIKPPDYKKHGMITFIDTLNFNRTSVENLGKIIGLPKMEIDKKLFEKKVLNKEEYNRMREYNINDSKISMLYMYHYQKTLNDLGGNIKITTPSSALDLFRRKFFKYMFIKESKILHDKTVHEFIENSYYGGRCEDFNKGTYENVNYYDVNSLYPYTMFSNVFPHPSTVSIGKGTISEISDYSGVSEVYIYCPSNIKIPLLPHRTEEGKIIYPTGFFKGIYTHAMLKEALQLGYTIINIVKQFIYKQDIPLFKDYVETLYNLRMKYKEEGSTEEQTVKLLMNSLYGKFGQKAQEMYEIIDSSKMTIELMSKKLSSGWKVQHPDNDLNLYICNKRSNRIPKNSFPIIASYVTSFAQIHMNKFLREYEPLYTDTDSIMTQKEIPQEFIGKGLGLFKLEKCGLVEIDSPKCYAFNHEPTLKGIHFKTKDKLEKYEIFTNYINHKAIPQVNFMKLKSVMRRKGFSVNQIVTSNKMKRITPTYKRIFDNTGNSKPIYME